MSAWLPACGRMVETKIQIFIVPQEIHTTNSEDLFQ